MLLLHSIRALFSFWEFGMALMIPAALVMAFALQAVIFRSQKRPWVPIAVTGGLLVLCELLADIAIIALERSALGVAFFGMAVEMVLLAVILGLGAGLLVGLLIKKKAAERNKTVFLIMPPAAAYHSFSLLSFLFSLHKKSPVERPEIFCAVS